jgi:hypothetical protein
MGSRKEASPKSSSPVFCLASARIPADGLEFGYRHENQRTRFGLEPPHGLAAIFGVIEPDLRDAFYRHLTHHGGLGLDAILHAAHGGCLIEKARQIPSLVTSQELAATDAAAAFDERNRLGRHVRSQAR